MKEFYHVILLIFTINGLVIAQESIVFLSYNTYNGFQNDTVVMDQYQKWIGKINPSVIAYQEMNNFSPQKLKKFAASYGHSHSVLSKIDGYPLAITSRFPISKTQSINEGMHHGYLYAQILNFHIFVVHLSPFDHEVRSVELRKVMEHASTFSEDARILIVGDFNALDRSDAGSYGKDLFRDLAKRDSTYNQNNLNANALDYTVMDILPEYNFSDTYWSTNTHYQYSMPTKKFRTRSVRRIDYIWAKNVQESEITDSGILVDQDTEVMSDHYPVFIQLKVE